MLIDDSISVTANTGLSEARASDTPVMPRLLFDVTRLLESGLHTGIQRVVRRLFAAAQRQRHLTGCAVLAVTFQRDQWFALQYLVPHPLEGIEAEAQPDVQPIVPGTGDHIMMFDASWYCDPWPAVDAARSRGAKVYGMVHDLLPLERSVWFRDGLQQRFGDHLQSLAGRAEMVFVPSETVRQRLLQKSKLPESFVQVLAHGGDFYSPGCQQQSSLDTVRQLASTIRGSFYCALGTLEPRKNHAFVLDAFEQLWSQGSSAQLVVVGNRGWRVNELLMRLDAHPQLGHKLFVFSDLDDIALHWLLKRAEALLYMSNDEGFGLPVLEAAMAGCAVICSDIPVLRETGGDWPHYVRLDDLPALVDALMPASNEPPRNETRTTPWRTWDQVAQTLYSFVALERVADATST